MSRDGPTLADMLATVAPLLATCVPCGEGHFNAVRLLRLVSKEVGCAAVRAARGCTIQLGGQAGLQPQQLIRLMSAASLKSLTVTLFISTGYDSSTMSAQLSVCHGQMVELLAGMPVALQSVLALTLKVVDQQSKVARKDCIRSRVEVVTSVKASWMVSGKVFAMLAVAVPNLSELIVSGCCWDAALKVFGHNCPNLVTLRVEAMHVAQSVFTNFASCLPNIEFLDIFNSDTAEDLDVDDVEDYVDAAMLATRTCTKLSKLRICISDLGDEVGCKPESWGFLPNTVVSFESNWSVAKSSQYEAFIRRVHCLNITDFPFDNLLDMVQTYPLLQRLKVKYLSHTSRLTLTCGEGPLVRERLLNENFQLDCIDLVLEGTYQEVQDALAWLPSFPSVELINICFWESTLMPCLEHLHRVFPNMKMLSLRGDERWSNNVSMDCELFSPLVACSHLTDLGVFLCINTTGEVFMQVCTSLAGLTSLQILATDDVNVTNMMAELHKTGREIEIVLVPFEDVYEDLEV